jgi:hypothetical protein
VVVASVDGGAVTTAVVAGGTVVGMVTTVVATVLTVVATAVVVVGAGQNGPRASGQAGLAPVGRAAPMTSASESKMRHATVPPNSAPAWFLLAVDVMPRS